MSLLALLLSCPFYRWNCHDPSSAVTILSLLALLLSISVISCSLHIWHCHVPSISAMSCPSISATIMSVSSTLTVISLPILSLSWLFQRCHWHVSSSAITFLSFSCNFSQFLAVLLTSSRDFLWALLTAWPFLKKAFQSLFQVIVFQLFSLLLYLFAKCFF